MSKKSLILSTLKMASATFSSRILGLVREQVMASMFGASGLTDAFAVAYRIPNMLRDLFAEGAFSSAFVPTFTKAKLDGKEGARQFLWSMFIVLLLLTGAIATTVIIFAPEVVALMTSESFLENSERAELCITMVKIMAPFLTFVSLAALFMGALNSLKIFFWPSMAPVFFNIVMIASMIFGPSLLISRGHHPIFSLAIGVLIGGFVQMLVQIPFIFKSGFGLPGKITFSRHYIGSTLNKLGIGTIGIAANQINILITTVLATGTVVGAVSWLTYSFRLFQFPVGVLSVSIAGSNLVHFSDEWKAGRRDQACDILRASYKFSWLVIIPAFALMFALSEQSVHLVFQRGAFSEFDTQQSTLALKSYLIGLPFYGLFKIFGPTFFSLDKAKVPVFISIFAISMNVVFCMVMVPKYGFSVLALGTSLSIMINCCLQGYFLRRYLKLRASFFIDISIIKYFLSGVIVFAVVHYLGQQFYIYNEGLLIRGIQFSAITLCGLLCYGISLIFMGEAAILKTILKKSR
jgi:putative peptidoglycan lipid II flippase